MITSVGLVIVVIVLDEERRVLRKRIDYAARALIETVFVILYALSVESPAVVVVCTSFCGKAVPMEPTCSKPPYMDI